MDEKFDKDMFKDFVLRWLNKSLKGEFVGPIPTNWEEFNELIHEICAIARESNDYKVSKRDLRSLVFDDVLDEIEKYASADVDFTFGSEVTPEDLSEDNLKRLNYLKSRIKPHSCALVKDNILESDIEGHYVFNHYGYHVYVDNCPHCGDRLV